MAALGHTVDSGSGASGDYASLSALESAQQQDLTDGGGDTYTATCITTGDNATDIAATFSTWTTSVDYYITIIVNPAYRHDGKWNATKYRITTAIANYVLFCDVAYTRIIGIQADQAYVSGSSNRYGIYVSAPGILISYCIARYTGTTSGTAYGISSTSGQVAAPCKIWNCISYNAPMRGFSLGGENNSQFVYNCTAIDCAVGFYCGYLDANLDMCLASDCADCFSGTFNSADHCAYTEGGDPGSNGHSVTRGTEFEFVNYAGDDFHIDATFDGTTDPSSGLFADDIDGDARSGTWDIGADEFVVVGGGIVVLRRRRM